MAENEDDKNLKALIRMMTHRMGRIPTEEEVDTYIFGTDEQREQIIPIGLVDKKV